MSSSAFVSALMAMVATLFVLYTLYWRANDSNKRLGLGVFSTLLLVYLGVGFAAYVFAAAMLLSWMSHRRQAAQQPLLIALALLILTIGLWKYVVGFLATIPVFNEEIKPLMITLGASYMGLRIADTYLSIHRRQLKNRNIMEIFSYLAFFPLLPAGPLLRSSPYFQQRLEGFSFNLLTQGLSRIARGAFKKLVVLEFFIQQAFGGLISRVNVASSIDDLTAAEAIAGVVLLMIRAFIDISAYTDMSVGTAKLLGFKVPEDMNFPLWKRNLAEFWRSWHMTVVSWCRDNIYMPTYMATSSLYLSTLTTFLFMGLWHNVDAQWFVWALYQACGMCAYLFLSRRYPIQDYPILQTPAWSIFAHILTFSFAAIAFAIMGVSSLADTKAIIRTFLDI